MLADQLCQPARVVVHYRQARGQVVKNLLEKFRGGGEGRNVVEHHQANLHRVAQDLGELWLGIGGKKWQFLSASRRPRDAPRQLAAAISHKQQLDIVP